MSIYVQLTFFRSICSAAFRTWFGVRAWAYLASDLNVVSGRIYLILLSLVGWIDSRHAMGCVRQELWNIRGRTLLVTIFDWS